MFPSECKIQREVQTFDYDSKEVIDLTHYVTCGDLVAVKVEPELSQNTTYSNQNCHRRKCARTRTVTDVNVLEPELSQT